MTPPRTPVERMLADAACLVKVATPEDWPSGFVVADRWLPGNVSAVAVGAGVGLGGALGYRGGMAAVCVNVARYVNNADAPTVVEVCNLERCVCHEAAHALVAPDATPEVVAGLLEDAGAAVAGYDANEVARQHGPRWAAAYWLAVSRGAAFRPGVRGQFLRELAQADLERYGFPPGDVERVTRGADLATPVRRLLAPGGPATALLNLALPDTETRAAAIVAAGIVRAAQPTGVA
jgi:hypothetical protein